MIRFIDEGRWLEPEREDGHPRQYEPAATVILKSNRTRRRLVELLQSDPQCTPLSGHILRK